MRVLERLLLLKDHLWYLYTRYEDSASFKRVSAQIASEVREDLCYHHNYEDYEYWDNSPNDYSFSSCSSLS